MSIAPREGAPRSSYQRIALAIFALAIVPLTVLAADPPASDAGTVCADAVPIPVDRVASASRLRAGETVCARFDLPEPGILMLETAAASGEPKLGLAGRTCDPSTPPTDVFLHERTPSRGIVEIPTAGPQVVCVASEDPRRPLRNVRLTSRFVAASTVPDFETVWTADGVGTHDKEDAEVDPILLRMATGGDVQAFAATAAASPSLELLVYRPGLLVIEQLAGSTETFGTGGTGGTSELTVVARKVVSVLPGIQSLQLLTGGGSSPRLHLRYFDVCQAALADDHGDVSFCASPLIPGEKLRGGWSDREDGDIDWVSFEIAAQRTVHLTSEGEPQLAGALYDDRGHRLAISGGGTGGDRTVDGDAQLVKTLAPGRYYLRLISRGRGGDAADAYSLTLDFLDW